MRKLNSHNQYSGFTLVEVLVALVVLSIGLLGLAGMQVESIQVSRDAVLRTKAVTLVADMIERIRANPTAAFNDEYVFAAAMTGTNNGCGTLEIRADDPSDPVTECNSAEMAQHDIWLWKQLLVDQQLGLPQPVTAVITSDGGAPPILTVTVTWTDSEQESSYSVPIQL